MLERKKIVQSAIVMKDHAWVWFEKRWRYVIAFRIQDLELAVDKMLMRVRKKKSRLATCGLSAYSLN